MVCFSAVAHHRTYSQNGTVMWHSAKKKSLNNSIKFNINILIGFLGPARRNKVSTYAYLETLAEAGGFSVELPVYARLYTIIVDLCLLCGDSFFFCSFI